MKRRYTIQQEMINGRWTGYYIPIGLGSFLITAAIRQFEQDTVRSLMTAHHPEAVEAQPAGSLTWSEKVRAGIRHESDKRL